MTDRHCGECTLCCKLLPVVELDKGANTRCQHQRSGKGCRVYGQRAMPPSCRLWSCRWLNGDAADIRRPDRSHYVIDVLPDYITMQDNETGELHKIPVLQIWVDPDYPDAHRDPQLRAYLDEKGKQGHMALVRYDNKRGFVLAAPSIASDGEWHELHTNMEPEGQHRASEIAKVLSGASIGDVTDDRPTDFDRHAAGGYGPRSPATDHRKLRSLRP